jgi:RNA polymerase subunit RPABC4/transcription elongation factor Spt4
LDIETFIARGLQILFALGGAYLLATWFVLAVWTFRDIESRSRNVVTQVFSTLLVVLFWVPGWLLYRLLRPSETLDEAYQRSLEEEYLLQDLQELPLCPSCNHFINDEWRVCPHCNTQLREDCDNCGHLIDLRWDICPYCAAPHSHDHDSQEVKVEDDRWIDPAWIEKRLREEELRRTREETRALPAATAATALGSEALSAPVYQVGDFRATEPDGETLPAARSNGQSSAKTARSASQEPDLSILGDDDDSNDDDESRDDLTVPERFRVQ